MTARQESVNEEEAGLPEYCRIVQLLHNRPARKTLLEVTLRRREPLHRLYWRPAGTVSYHLLGAPTTSQSFRDAVTCERPLLYFLSEEWTDRPGFGLGSSDPVLMRADLDGEPAMRPADLSGLLPNGAWLSRLLRAREDG